MSEIYYPKANRTAQWFGNNYPGADMRGVNKVLLHTTETNGWPGYGGGASAPNLTYNPWTREWRQHIRLDRSSRALRNDGSRQTNRQKVVQVEIICYSDENLARQRGHRPVSELTANAYRDLADFLAYMHLEYDVPLRAVSTWLRYPGSYGNTSARFGWNQFVSFQGLIGHSHAPGNSHGDPSNIDASRIVRLARESVNEGVSMSWSEDLSRDSSGPKITGMADDYLPSSWGRNASQLLGYAAMGATQARIDFAASRFWNRENPTVEEVYGSMIRWILNATRPDRSQTPGARVGFLVDLDEIKEQNRAILSALNGVDSSTILEEIRQNRSVLEDNAEAVDSAVQKLVNELDSVRSLLEDFESGTLDAEQVLDQMAERLLKKGEEEVEGNNDADEG